MSRYFQVVRLGPHTPHLLVSFFLFAFFSEFIAPASVSRLSFVASLPQPLIYSIVRSFMHIFYDFFFYCTYLHPFSGLCPSLHSLTFYLSLSSLPLLLVFSLFPLFFWPSFFIACFFISYISPRCLVLPFCLSLPLCFFPPLIRSLCIFRISFSLFPPSFSVFPLHCFLFTYLLYFVSVSSPFLLGAS